MAQPLTKTKGDGGLYVRPARVEAKIDLALQQGWATILAWAAQADPKHDHYLPSECLVHLVRKAHRDDADRERDKLLRHLLKRAATYLQATLPNHRAPNADYIRKEALGRLGELFANDMADENPDELDFFECQFKTALRALKTDLIRTEVRTQQRFKLLPEDEDGDQELSSPDPQAKLAIERAQFAAPQESEIFTKRLAEAMSILTPGERDAVVLHAMGYKEESQDPNEATIATRCGITGRAVRYRLTKAGEKLSRFKEER